MDTQSSSTPEEPDETLEAPTVTDQAAGWRHVHPPRGHVRVSGTLLAGAAAAIVVMVTAAALTVILNAGSSAGLPDTPSVVSDPTTAPADAQGASPGVHTWKNGQLVVLRTGPAAKLVLPVHAPAASGSAAPTAPRRSASPAPSASVPASSSAPASAPASTTPPASPTVTVASSAPSTPKGNSS